MIRSVSYQNMRPVSVPLFIIFIGCVGLMSYAVAGPSPVSPGGTGSGTEPVTSDAGSTQSGSSANQTGTQAAPTNTASSSATNSQNYSATPSSQDDQSTPLGTDGNGFPILKRKSGAQREKVIELKDGQKLPTSGVDPKFQGSLLNVRIDPINSIVSEANKDSGSNEDPRFQSKHLSLTKDGTDLQKKSSTASVRLGEDPSPSPTPSATASPGATGSPSGKSKADR